MDILGYIKIICPPLFGNNDVAGFINMAQNDLSISFWGTKYPEAVALLASHIWFRFGSGGICAGGYAEAGSTGAITSKREGNTQITYQSIESSTSDDADLTTSRYGLRLIALRKSLMPFVFTSCRCPFVRR